MSAGLSGFVMRLCRGEPSSSTAVYIVRLEYSVVRDRYFFRLYMPKPVRIMFYSESNIMFLGFSTPWPVLVTLWNYSIALAIFIDSSNFYFLL